MELQAAIIKHLRSIDDPCTVQDIAHAIGMLEPGDGVPETVRTNLTIMVRRLHVKRHHNGDGVLRYSLGLGFSEADAASPTKSEPLDDAAPAATAPTRAAHRYETNVSVRVLDAFVAGEAPIRRTVLESRISPALTTTQVVMALQALRLKGKVERHGTTAAATWSRMEPVPLAADPPRLGAVHHALLNARLAIDAALQAMEA